MVRIQLFPYLNYQKQLIVPFLSSVPRRAFAKPTIRKTQGQYFRRADLVFRQTPSSKFFKALRYQLRKPCSTSLLVKLMSQVFPTLSKKTLNLVSKKLRSRLYLHFVAFPKLIRLSTKRYSTSPTTPKALLDPLGPSLAEFEGRLSSGRSSFLFHNTDLHAHTLQVRYARFPRTLDLITTVLILRLYNLIVAGFVTHSEKFRPFRSQH